MGVASHEVAAATLSEKRQVNARMVAAIAQINNHRHRAVAAALALILVFCGLLVVFSIRDTLVNQRVDLITVWWLRWSSLIGLNKEATDEEMTPVAANWGGVGIANVGEIIYQGGEGGGGGGGGGGTGPEDSSAFLI
jgi:hypothetical protein